MAELFAVCAALVAAFLNATAGLLQHRATKKVSARHSLEFTLLRDLARERWWQVGIVAAIVAFCFQATALRFGSVTLVQPLLVVSLLLTVLLRAAGGRAWPRPSAVLGAVCCAAGLSVFLAVANPRQGPSRLDRADAFPLAIVLAGLLAVCLFVAHRTRGNSRGVALGMSAGLFYGVTAGLVKIATRQVDAGAFEPLRHWELYVALACGIVGVQLNQGAFQAGSVAAPVAVITVTDPLTSIAIGLMWLGERVDMGPTQLAGEAFALAALVAGVALLARERPGKPVPRTPYPELELARSTCKGGDHE